ncbi:putative NADP-dependent alcohol dehydrogenase C 2 [Roridomyces roridus]|uniref:NADP-dependent alcohol dehydrogenase C 2 n=1 Tax=Roridomyces roridus TaxID=1738132 RepID=A0AAD7FFU9_9AGAR|nr:putative NADP-dependent alcohol dehydrogenase C 2 [Roridomyces roridus]
MLGVGSCISRTSVLSQTTTMSIDITVFKGSPNGIVEAKTSQPLPIGNQVLIRITHSGVCGSDEIYAEADFVLGHEGVGIIQQVGEAVDKDKFKVGDVVGWGYVHRVCGKCEQCLHGHDQYCTTAEYYGHNNHHQGSFSSHAIWDASVLYKIPHGLAPEYAAPLMCAGATVFGAIEEHNIRPTDRVGVVGVGGLGHMAIRFLSVIGAEVVVFSSTQSKRTDAMRLGATEFHPTQGAEKFEGVKQVDHLLVTTSSLPDWTPYLSVVKARGKIFLLTVSFDNVVIPNLPLVAFGLTVQGSMVACRSVHERMLEFAVRNKVEPVIEQFPMTRDGIQEVMDRLKEGKVRYRAVVVAQ